MDLKTIGIVGVGAMGLAMEKKLIEAGHEVIGYRRSAMDDLVTAEALAFAVREGADPAAIHQAISGSVASSAMFELRGAMMVKREYPPGGGVAGFLHGLELIDGEARAVGAVAPMIAKTVETYRAAVDAGFTGPDQAGLFDYLLAEADKTHG